MSRVASDSFARSGWLINIPVVIAGCRPYHVDHYSPASMSVSKALSQRDASTRLPVAPFLRYEFQLGRSTMRFCPGRHFTQSRPAKLTRSVSRSAAPEIWQERTPFFMAS
jgi:hypothetical protein